MTTIDKINDAIVQKKARQRQQRSVYLAMEINLLAECRSEIQQLQEDLRNARYLAEIYAHKGKEYYNQYKKAADDVQELRSVLVNDYGDDMFARDYSEYGPVKVFRTKRQAKVKEIFERAREEVLKL